MRFSDFMSLPQEERNASLLGEDAANAEISVYAKAEYFLRYRKVRRLFDSKFSSTKIKQMGMEQFCWDNWRRRMEQYEEMFPDFRPIYDKMMGADS